VAQGAPWPGPRAPSSRSVDALQGLEQGDCKQACASQGGIGQRRIAQRQCDVLEAKCPAARGNQRKATSRLNEVVNCYPKSDKAPAALWTQAELQQQSGDSRRRAVP
jgi:hypothetical protein